jgi:hypothetical protein
MGRMVLNIRTYRIRATRSFLHLRGSISTYDELDFAYQACAGVDTAAQRKRIVLQFLVPSFVTFQ